MNMKKIFKEEESIEILKILYLIANKEEYLIYIIISEGNMSQEFTLKNIEKTRNFLIEEIS